MAQTGARPSPVQPGGFHLDGVVACLNSWLERATQMEVQARQARAVQTIGALTLGSALAAAFVSGGHGGLALAGFFPFAIAALFFNHHQDYKTTIWRRASEVIQNLQYKLVTSPGDPDIRQIAGLHPRKLLRYYRRITKLVVLDSQSIIIYLTVIAVWFTLGLFALGQGDLVSG
jgi:hypothetical protein